jgi:hypothetical protein
MNGLLRVRWEFKHLQSFWEKKNLKQPFSRIIVKLETSLHNFITVKKKS